MPTITEAGIDSKIPGVIRPALASSPGDIGGGATGADPPSFTAAFAFCCGLSASEEVWAEVVAPGGATSPGSLFATTSTPTQAIAIRNPTTTVVPRMLVAVRT